MKTKLSIGFAVSVFLFVSILMVRPAVAALQPAPQTAILYAKPTGLSAGLCDTWLSACKLTYALSIANTGAEIWVQEGTYTPTDGTDRSATFQLKSGVVIYGGFTGDETARDQRDIVSHVTILSGEIGAVGSADNSYHVVTGSGADASAVMDGFTITAGTARPFSPPYQCGGGMYTYNGSPTVANVTFIGNEAYYGGGMCNESSSPTLVNTTFSNNNASYSGGGMYNYSSTTVLTNVSFSNNTADDGGGVYNSIASDSALTDVVFSGNAAYHGGGMYDDGNQTVLTNVTFNSNTATIYGGGMVIFSSPAALTNVTFDNNISEGLGGGMISFSSSPSLTNVTFIGNSALEYGGGMDNNDSNSTLTNVTFSNNSAAYGGGMSNYNCDPVLLNITFSGNSADHGGGGMYNQASNPTLIHVTFHSNSAVELGGGIHNYFNSAPSIHNSILWGNSAPDSAQIFNTYNSIPDIFYSDIQDGCPASSNCSNVIAEDPLLGTLGNYGGLTLVVPLLPGSAAIDSADQSVCPADDQRGIPRPQGADCDMGAFEQAGWIHYASPGGLSAGACSSWADACELRYALAIASSGAQIWVQQGAYTPTGGTDRSATFQLKNGVSVYGGFAGDETDVAQRTYGASLTTLSGEIGENGSTDNSYHVVTSSGTDATAVLDGFTIRDGNADGGVSISDYRGAGIYNDNGAPYLQRIALIGNHAGDDGGGMYNLGGNPIITDVSFSGNSAAYNGGGMYNSLGNPILNDVSFDNNWAYDCGSGIYNNMGDPSLFNVTFYDNYASNQGGGMYNKDSSPALTNVTITGNSAIDGGGIYNLSSNPTLDHVTIRGNHATNGGGGIYNWLSSPVVHNSILWGNQAADGAQIYNGSTSTPAIRYSDIEGGCPAASDCTNVITDDPLLGTLGDYGGFAYAVPLLPGSPAVDAAESDAGTCPVWDQRYVPRPQGAGCDMGAFEQLSGILYAGPDASQCGVCDTWLNRCRLDYALALAGPGIEIWVQEGTHTPTSGASRSATFQLKEGVALYGGFWGDETARDQRDPAHNVTILSGEIGAEGNADNSYHVVTGSGTDATAVLDGFTITAGNANSNTSPDHRGGGMYNEGGSPMLSNLIFIGNSANAGGGMYNYENSHPSLAFVTFTNNNAARSAGGMYNYLSNPSLTDIIFSGNSSGGPEGGQGGGMLNYLSNPTLLNVTFEGNSTAVYGGGMRNLTSNPTLTNVTFSGNYGDWGGGMNNDDSSSPTLTNVTFSGNVSTIGAGGGMYNEDSTPIINNCILWGNSSPNEEQIYNANSVATITYSLIQGGCPAESNCSNVIAANPFLGTLGDYGGYTPVIPIRPGSAAIDSADGSLCPVADQRGLSRPQGPACDMGAVEFDYIFSLFLPLVVR